MAKRMQKELDAIHRELDQAESFVQGMQNYLSPRMTKSAALALARQLRKINRFLGSLFDAHVSESAIDADDRRSAAAMDAHMAGIKTALAKLTQPSSDEV